jgi:hypothetical protein
MSHASKAHVTTTTSTKKETPMPLGGSPSTTANLTYGVFYTGGATLIASFAVLVRS